jgi:predicted aspartyl protease
MNPNFIFLALILFLTPEAPAIDLQMIDGHPIVETVLLNGSGPHVFLIDTGSAENYLDPEVAASMFLKPTLRTSVITSGGKKMVTGVEDVEIAVNTVRIRHCRFLLDGMEQARVIDPGIEGILGQEFLANFDYLLDLKHKRLELGGRQVLPAAIRVSLQTSQHRPLIPTSMGLLVLDSGANRPVFFGIANADQNHELITMTGPVRVGLVFRSLSIHGRRFWRGEAVAVAARPEPEAAGLMPISIFQAIFVCNSGGYVALN